MKIKARECQKKKIKTYKLTRDESYKLGTRIATKPKKIKQLSLPGFNKDGKLGINWNPHEIFTLNNAFDFCLTGFRLC